MTFSLISENYNFELLNKFLAGVGDNIKEINNLLISIICEINPVLLVLIYFHNNGVVPNRILRKPKKNDPIIENYSTI